jgi:hypothetical protein
MCLPGTGTMWSVAWWRNLGQFGAIPQFFVQTLLEVEYNVPVKAMNASKAARTVHVSGQFMPQTIDGMNRQEVLVRRLFETTSLRKAFFFTKIFQITLNEACEGENRRITQ